MLLDPCCVCCGAGGGAVCARCEAQLAPPSSLPAPLGIDVCGAALDYRGAGPLFTALKNGGRRDLVGWLADSMAASLAPPLGAVVTWAPTGVARRQARGFDQAELLARAVARRWRRPCRGLLVRAPGPAQAGRRADERRRNPAFVTRRRVPPAVVVVDDVATTGATLAAAARALRLAGADQVVAVVGARSHGRRAA